MFWAARALHWRGQRASRGRESSVIRNSRRAGARSLQLLIFNEEFLVSAIHQIALITSLPFVHTARRSYRLNGAVRRSDGLGSAVRCAPCPEVRRTLPFRGRRSRNKVSVGEPAEGSLPNASLRPRPANSCAGPFPPSFRGVGRGRRSALSCALRRLARLGGARRRRRQGGFNHAHTGCFLVEGTRPKKGVEGSRIRSGSGLLWNPKTTLNNGYLGSRNDEERSELRNVV